MFSAARPMVSALRILCWLGIELRASFVHPDGAPVERLAVKRGDRSLGVDGLRHLDKSHAARFAGVPVHDDRDRFYGAMGGKNFAQPLLGYRDIQVSDKNVGHDLIPVTDLPKCLLPEYHLENVSRGAE
jgi:hypothetical protein